METLQGYIFDLDGTLYDFGGTKFSDSRLGKTIRMRYVTLISSIGYSDAQQYYQNMCTIEKEQGIGLSLQLAIVLGKSRTEVLEDIWGSIDPRDIVTDVEYSQRLIPCLYSQGKRLFLVTGAPKLWANKILAHLELTQYFESIFGLEDFTTSKKEVFLRIARKTSIDMKAIISIGDQYMTDIIPAEELGMQTFLVQKPKDLLNIFTI